MAFTVSFWSLYGSSFARPDSFGREKCVGRLYTGCTKKKDSSNFYIVLQKILQKISAIIVNVIPDHLPDPTYGFKLLHFMGNSKVITEFSNCRDFCPLLTRRFRKKLKMHFQFWDPQKIKIPKIRKKRMK